MKIVDESEYSAQGTQLTLSFEALDIGDQSYLPVATIIESANANPLAECNVVEFRRPAVSSVEAGLLARILERTRHFV